MDKKTAQQLIEKTFNDSFNEEQFTIFAKNLLNDLEPKSNIYSGNLLWDDYKEHINSYKRIGKYIDPQGDALDVLIVEVKNINKLERARTVLRNFVIKHLSKFEKDYALVAFYSKGDGGDDWRFSFVKLEYRSEFDEEKGKVKTKKEFTPAKRYSFLVGKYEKSHTAQNQLLPLLQNIANNPTISELENAFSIEKVTDEFFNQYKDLYVKLFEHFKKDKNIQTELEKSNIDNARFTKKLLGQIVFLYFLQKKGWLGVLQNKKWGTGNKRFVQDLFDIAESENVNFFKDKLQYLFYEALAKERDNENSFYEKLNCRIPFLNGGLFEADYNWKKANITIPTALFRSGEEKESERTGILDVFGRYNFTIKEDEPLDKEVAVDPEMLGKVFENMLEVTERKSKGAFYTPREIVHYMCQESLIHYLDNALNDATQSYQPIDSDQVTLFGGSTNKKGQAIIELEHNNNNLVPKTDIEDYIREGHFALENDQRVASKGETRTYQYQLPESIRQNADLIDQKLNDIRICDPAIGSGAFPVGLLHELVNAMLVLKPHFSYDYRTKKLKDFGIEHKSVSESRYIYRLKRHIIQESIYGVDIDASAIDIARLRLWLSLVVDEDDLDPIETLPNLDYKIVCGNSLIGLPDQGADKYPQLKDELELLKKDFFKETNELKKKELRNDINKKIKTVLSAAEDFEGYKIDFDYQLFFSEVWTEKGGFDVVIGNPPYVQIQYLSEEVKNVLKKFRYKTFSLRGDIYELFFEKGEKLLKKSGHLCYITSNKWMRANYGKTTRNYLLNDTNPKLLFDFGQEMVFSSAIVHSNILLFQKSKYQNNFLGSMMQSGQFTELDLSNYFKKNSIKLDYALEDVWSISNLGLVHIKNIIEKRGKKLSKWSNKITRGIITGFNEAFILEQSDYDILCKNEKNKELLKKIIRGRDTRKYYCNDSNKWMIISRFKENKIIENDFPDIFEYLKSYELQLKARGQVINGQHHWLELDNTPSKSFFEQFENPKIVFSEIVSDPQFCYETTGLYPEATSFFITGDNLKWLCALLNSEPITQIFRVFYAGGELVGKYRYKKTFLNSLPVPEPSKEFQTPIELIVDYLTFYKGLDYDLSNNQLIAKYFETILDVLVYEIIFPKELQKANKQILTSLGNLKPINDSMSEEEKLAIIQAEFERLYDDRHPVKFAIETLDSIEEVRIIKESVK